MKTIICIVATAFISNLSWSQTWETNKAKPDGNGCLTYEIDAEQNRIPDFSNAGFKGGGEAIPTIPTTLTVSPISGDNTLNIQTAIDSVSSLPINSDGFRGCVELAPGTYEIEGQLFLQASGVVLRGSGDGRDGNPATILYGVGNIPVQRTLILAGGGINDEWQGQVPGTLRNIVTSFVPVGSRTFEVDDASPFTVGDNIIINHPCTNNWLQAVDYGAPASDPNWNVNQVPLVYNRFITAISGNSITIDAPVFNHLDNALSQAFIYTYDRQDLVVNVGIENLRIDIESLGGTDENHVWNSLSFTQAEDVWVRKCTMTGFGLSAVIFRSTARASAINVHAVDPVAQVSGGRMYNFHFSTHCNNVLVDNCYARAGRHHYIANGKGTVSGVVVLRSKSENPYSVSEGHRQWSQGMLFDNLMDYGTYPNNKRVLAFYNRGASGSSHGWSAAHSVMWNSSTARPGTDARIVVEKPPTAQNYAIGCKGSMGFSGAFNQPIGYIEGSNLEEELVPNSLYEAQLLCRKDAVFADFYASTEIAATEETVVFTDDSKGNIQNYSWNFGQGATPATASGSGPHNVTYSTVGLKSIRLTVSNVGSSHEEVKCAYVVIDDENLHAVDDTETTDENTSVTTDILNNDMYSPPFSNEAYTFDGVDDNIAYDDFTLFDQYPVTMAAWVRTTSTNDQTIIYLGNPSSNFTGNSLSMSSGELTLEAWLYDGGAIQEEIEYLTPINDGNWHHIAGVFESPTSRFLYVDGALVGTDNAALDNVTVQELESFSVGNREDSTPNGYFEGDVDEVRLYQAALTEIEVNDIMNGWDCSSNEKILLWDFESVTATTINDDYNSFDGTISGGNTIGSTVGKSDLNAIIVSGPSNGSASMNSSLQLEYLPNAGFVGMDTIVYELSMGECELSTATVVYTVGNVSIATIEMESLKVYPNPTHNAITIDFSNMNPERIELLDMNGRLIRELPLEAQHDVSFLPNGIYLLQVLTKDAVLWHAQIIKR